MEDGFLIASFQSFSSMVYRFFQLVELLEG